ncbi:chemosensory receptor a [Plakobranchus ocellatus]|uniref:Chemosensory receptor a n=1 Tax=Plakobranchus ocellatus TaxID=259542 RepID=A0AAV4DDG5_9GAST|nr:chemosensory receptor a [Plakobranchus ocellatus]
MPLQFKSVFTKSRTVTAVLILFILAVSFHIPVMSMFTIVWSTEPQSNVSFPYVTRKSSDSIIRYSDMLNRTTLPWINFIIMIACVAIIKLKLYQSSRVRRSQTSKSVSDPKQAHEAANNHERSSKDLRVIQSVVLICCIFIVSQLPFLVYSTGRLINPEFDVFKKQQNLFYIFTTISRTFSYLNASVNIFVYYNYNSKYRLIFLSITKWKVTSTSETQ